MIDQVNDIENLLRVVKSKIDAHNDFKEEYNKQLAFDFSLFNFFNVGENKISTILAYFLDEKASHGQGNIFLKEFVNSLYDSPIDISKSSVTCEKIITNNRRIDIYIELKDIVIGIENKVWADDQPNQLNDYANYLKKETNGKFLLLYLTPYGHSPSKKSIDKDFKNTLVEEKKFEKISYKQDILELLDKWSIICEADNVTYFIKEFKKFLKSKFLGNNTLNMSKKLRSIIFQNHLEVKSLVDEYQTIENEIRSTLNEVGKLLSKENPKLSDDLELSKSDPFNWDGKRIYKHSISRDYNKIWIEFVQRDIYLYSKYYFQKGTDSKFIEIAKATPKLNNNVVVDYTISKPELIRLFIDQVELVNSIFNQYDKSKKKA